MNTTTDEGYLRQSNRIFERHEENLLMLEQFLAELEARYIRLSAAGEVDPVLASKVQSVFDRYRYCRDEKASGRSARLPDWAQAFVVEQLLTKLMPPDEARSELARQLSDLEDIDAQAYTRLAAEWDAAVRDNQAEARAGAMLVAVQRAAQWKKTEKWIIRQLGVLYARRLLTAFVVALVVGIVLVIIDANSGIVWRDAAFSGIFFAAAAGLLGASFSAMVGQSRVVELDNIEDARAATSKMMIYLRLGVGTAAALILYFFFEAGMIDGDLFPNLSQIGFGPVRPAGVDADAVRGLTEALVAAATQIGEGLDTARQSASTVDGFDAAKTVNEAINRLAMAATADPKLLAGLDVSIQTLSEQLAKIEASKGQWHVPLGSVAPNADLSKLVVWCFAAGFIQTLVPSLLHKVGDRVK